MKQIWIAGCAAAMVLAAPLYAYDGWHQESATPIESKNASFDYITYDGTAHRLFLGHRKEGLQVFDLATKKIVKVIDGTPGHSSNGALLMPEYDLGISNNEDGTITPFKMSTLEAREAIKLAEAIDTSHYDPSTKRIVVNTGAGKEGTDLIVLETPSLKVAGKIFVKTVKAEHAEGDGKGNFYLASREPAKLYRIDTKSMKVTAEWDTPGCAQTNSLALDAANNRIFLGCRGSVSGGAVKPSLAVVNAETGAVIYTSEIGANNDGVIFDPQTKRIFAANGGSANINIFEQIDANTYKPLEVLNTHPTVKVLAYDHINKKLYSMGAEASLDVGGKRVVRFPNSFVVYTYSK
ncbi:MAG: YncE family protein [Burkholderiales bacterium]